MIERPEHLLAWKRHHLMIRTPDFWHALRSASFRWLIFLTAPTSAAVAADLIVDQAAPYSNSPYTLSSGTLSLTNTYVGNVLNSTGQFDQTGGAQTVSNALALGRNFSTGSYNLSGAASTLSAPVEYIGFTGDGTFSHSSGSNTGVIYVGAQSGSTGTYNLSGAGALNGGNGEFVGFSGLGFFNQSGGTNSTNTLWVGFNPSGVGSYVMSAGTLDTAYEVIGQNGQGNFSQSGGVNTITNTLTIGNASPGSSNFSTYTLTGGALAAPTEQIGFAPGIQGAFVQWGGTNTVDSVVLAKFGQVGNYYLYGGVLQVGTISAGSGGSSIILDGGTLQAKTDTTAFMGGLTTAAIGSNGVNIDTNGRNITISQSISQSDNGALTKQGAGALTLTGANTYTGGTQVTEGILLVNNTAGSGTGTGPVTVSDGATLGGVGAIQAGSNDVTIQGGGMITGATNGIPGNLSITASDVLFNGSSGSVPTFVVDLTNSSSDRLTISGNLDLTTLFDQILLQGTPAAQSYQLVTTGGLVLGVFDQVTNLPDGYNLVYTGTGIDLVAVVPEPSTMFSVLLGSGVLAAMGWRRGRRLRGRRGNL